ncbi:winged helix-turn-helix domain-containing protein [Thalassomonas actiniarum]|uniref:Winged helix-turn-helix domain-containing protein n=1 Tax=Thalassomonas actiniarum TaxID=485447 RepID=A0AAE9YMX1_9GAMM|nr:winged helix-turn-helix domain-containing protein [Thalassomonas actiniarum]WDD97741.1 winged helix-turn-helix domain-containing protein [Thalassomonas actiniarum]
MENTKLIKLNQWILDPVENHLIKDDNTCIPLEAKHVLLLVFLAETPNNIISREQLMQTVWKNRCVEQKTINAAISRLRKILGGDRDDFIKTHLKRGYSLACKVEYLDRDDLLLVDSLSAKNTRGKKEHSEIAKSKGKADNASPHTAPDVKKRVSATENKTNGQTKKRFSTKPFYKLYSLIATLLLAFVLWQLVKPIKPSSQILTKHDAPDEPLTYLQGRESSPVLSSNKTLLAFTHRPDNSPYSRLVIQNIETKEHSTIKHDKKVVSPYWSPSGDELFYISVEQDNCTVKKVRVSQSLRISPPITVTQCSPYLPHLSSTGIAIDSDLNWLYYTAKDADKPQGVIKRYHLKKHNSEVVTAPQGKYQGDASLRLSPDNSKLAYKRYYDDHSESIMILDLNSGETKSLINNSSLSNSIGWTITGSHVLYIDKKEEILNSINISTGDITALYQFDTNATHPLMHSVTEVLFTLGESSTTNINYLNLGKEKQVASPLITSSFKDHSAAFYNAKNTKRVAFASNRSGNEQIWLKEADQFQQLTHYEDKAYIYELHFSANGEIILFIRNDKLYALNTNTKQIKAIPHPNKTVKNIDWLCHSNDNILTTVLEDGSWHLYQLNIYTQKTKKLANGITSIHSQCANNDSKYYASTTGSKGIYQLTDNWKINDTYHYFPGVDLDYNLDWAIGDDAVYRITRDRREVFKVDFATGQNEKVDIGDTNTLFITIHYNNLLMNDFAPVDTYIGKITIPDLQNRLSN